MIVGSAFEHLDAPQWLTLDAAVSGHAQTAPTAVALVSGRGRQWTYSDLLALSNAARAQLATVGAGPRDIVAIDAREPAHLALAVAIVASAAVSAPLADAGPGERSRSMIRRLRAAALVTDGEGEATELPTIDAEDLLEVGTSDATPASAVSSTEREGPHLDDLAVVFATSGTSAQPKLVPNTHRNLRASAVAAEVTTGFHSSDRCLVLGPMWHTLGVRALTDALHVGGSVIVPDQLDSSTLADHLERDEPTCVVALPAALPELTRALAQLPAATRAAIAASIRFVRTGAAPLPPAVAARLAEMLPAPVVRGYGMTEVAKIACAALGSDPPPPGSVGRPVAVDLRILHADGSIAATGEEGEVVVRGASVAPGYLDDPVATSDAFCDGWFHTGDIGRVDEHGCLYLSGRRDDTVNRGGEPIALGALDRAVEGHPAVEAALATAVPHPTLGSDVVVSYVVTRGAPAPSPGELRRFLSESVAPGQLPTRFNQLDALPMTASGKPSRKALASLIQQEREDQQSIGASSRSKRPSDIVSLRLSALWAELLGLRSPVGPDDDFFALGGDSLMLLELCAMIATQFGVVLLPGELIAQPSLRQMAAVVASEEHPASPRRTLVMLREGASGRLPLFLVPGGGGSVAALQRFVYQLAPGRPMFGFEARGLYPGERPLRSVRRLARLYNDELLEAVEAERFFLAGTSFGAIVAQQMAVELQRHGRAPELLVMIDCPSPEMLAADQHERPADTTVSQARRRVADELDWITLRRDSALGFRARMTRCIFVNRVAARSHRPRTSSVPTAFVSSGAHRRRTGEDLLGWSRYLGGEVTLTSVDGEHVEAIRDRAHEIAPWLDRLFDERDAAATPLA
jgi:acyl-CoA synthetase (AMP-forming)/AMP-acid ligase II/thioesterase domain-containing protein/acyl carrier protein